MHKRKALRAFHQSERGLWRNELVKFCMITVALFFFAAALARPAFTKSGAKQGAQQQFLFLVDTSTSMGASLTPVSPTSLDRAKKIIGDTLKEFPDSCAAIFLFSKLTFPVSSLTCDRNVLQDVLEKEMRIDRIPNKGTDLLNALLVVGDNTKNPASIYGPVTQVIILSDGGDTPFRPGDASDVSAAFPSSVQITFVGVGEAAGAPIPVFEKNGSFTGSYMQADGSIYYARLNDAIMRDMAAQLHGSYFSQDQEQALLGYLHESSQADTDNVLHGMDLRILALALSTAAIFVLLWRRDL